MTTINRRPAFVAEPLALEPENGIWLARDDRGTLVATGRDHCDLMRRLEAEGFVPAGQLRT